MKRYGNLWPEVIRPSNLLRAAEKARRGKRHRPATLKFDFDLERQVAALHEELASQTYRPGPFRTFMIHEPKPRQISAAPYRDRVVHHALCNVLEPIFERSMIFDSYACRAGKGTHAAVRRCQQYARRFCYVWKADVRKFFPSIDHDLLKAAIARKIKDRDVHWLVGLIVDHSNAQDPVVQWFPGDDLFAPLERRRGLPLGNQTSQFFANVYLDPLDHFLRDRLGVGGYVRYVDDFLVFGDDKRHLAEVRDRVDEFLDRLRLTVHPNKSVIARTDQGIRFLGYRVFATHRLLVKENVRRFRRRLRRMQAGFADGSMTLESIRPRILSWIGHARQADTLGLRARLLQSHLFSRASADPPRPSGGLVQQHGDEPARGEPQQERAGQPQQEQRVSPRQHFAAGVA